MTLVVQVPENLWVVRGSWDTSFHQLECIVRFKAILLLTKCLNTLPRHISAALALGYLSHCQLPPFFHHLIPNPSQSGSIFYPNLQNNKEHHDGIQTHSLHREDHAREG